MSDKRRRRKGTGEGEDEGSDLSETEPETKAPVVVAEHGDSEYESADDNLNPSPKHKAKAKTEGGEEEEEEDVEYEGENEYEEDEEEDFEYEGNGGGEEPFPGVERQEGDGEETPTPDDDEDKKNPQYIPKKGMFYEHDDRCGTDEEPDEAKEGEKKKIWKADAAEKWGHDKFAEFDQDPKSKDELVASYGYDIRNEDNAPRARRRRRYGRGPNKYTRNWEDEDAYSKPAPNSKPKMVPNKTRDSTGQDVILEDFPALPSRDDESKQENPVLRREKSKPEMRRENLNNRRSEERDLRRSEDRDERRGYGRGGDGIRSRGRGRAMRGGGDPPRRGAGGGERGFGRGGYEDRKRYDRYLDRRSNDDDRRQEDDYRGGRGGGRGRDRGGGRGNNRDYQDRRRQVQDQSVIVRPEDFVEDLANIDINKGAENSSPSMRGGAKRYSHQRRGGAELSMNHEQRNLQEIYDEGLNPAMCSGPPRGPPFQTHLPPARLPHNSMVQHSGLRPVPANFIQNPQMINYSTQFTSPVTGPPVSLPIGVGAPVPLSVLSGNVSAPMLAPGFSNGPEAVMMAAAANQSGPDGFAAVRGGVTYFNPTAQNILQQRPPVSKRPKAAIPIVDPAVVETKDYIDTSLDNQELVPQH